MKYNKTHILFFILALGTLMSLLCAASMASAADMGVVSATVQLAVCGDGVKDQGEQCDLGDLGGKSCTDLGYDGGALGCSPSCQFDVSSCSTEATASSAVTLSPLAGATYILPDGGDSLNLSLPAAFHTNDLSLVLFSKPGDVPIPSGEDMVGRLYKLIFVNENGDVVHQLQKASTITLSYAAPDLGSASESTLAPYRSEDSGATWTAIPGYSLDQADKTVTFTTTDFSLFSIFGSAGGSPVAPPSGGGGSGGGGSAPSAPEQASPAERQSIVKAADFNGDGVVDMSDLSILLYYYGKTGSAAGRYDLNGDGVVDISDISIMLYYWEITS